MKNVKTGHIRPIVCLDPGHDSSHANPSPVVAGYYEGQQMWDLAQLLKARLESMGIDVRLTKQQLNQALDLVVRGKLSKGADLFISLHSNAASTAAPDWVLVLHQVDNGSGVHNQSRSFAQEIAPRIGQIMGLDHQLYGVKSSADRDGNGLADDYYGVLRGAQAVGTPGVIIEHGFHTNAACAQWLLSGHNLERLAEAEAEIIAKWFDFRSADGVQCIYRIRRCWEDAKSQIGAYRQLENAISACLPGYTVFDWNGKAVHTSQETYTLSQFVRQVQLAIGAGVDGIAGPETLSKTPTISAVKNNRHKAVLPVQKRLFALGYTQVGEADGIAGPMFTAAVKAFQKDNGCVVDGEITAREKTWQRLLEYK